MPPSNDPTPSDDLPPQEEPGRRAQRSRDDASADEALSVEISLRRRAEEKAEEVERRFQLMITGAEDYAFFMMDGEGCIISWNRGARKLFGWSEKEVLGEHFRVLFPTDAQKAGDPEKELNTAMENGAADDDRWHARKDGSQFWTHGVTTALRDRHVGGFAKIVRDLTVEKRQADQLAEKSRQLAAANDQKDQFLAVLSHELRNPLAPIRTATELICGEAGQHPEIEEACAILQRQVEVMVRLVDDLLDVSRITSGKIRLKKEGVDLREIVDQAVKAARSLIDRRRQQLSLSVPDSPVRLHADPVRIEQVMTNLLTNAAKYTSDGGEIRVALEQQEEMAVVRVRDTGEGISSDVLPNLFTMFAQVDHSKDHSQGGMGIGLALVRSLVEMHGGTIQAHSEGAGQGSEFTVRLPISSEESRPLATPPLPEEASNAVLRVLVVDDNVDSARLMTMMLGAMNYQTRAEFSGSEGLDAARQFRPHVILLDIGMPGMDGYELARRVRSDPELRDVHLVAITGYGQEVDRERSREVGIDHHLVKPVQRSTLTTLLEDIAQDI